MIGDRREGTEDIGQRISDREGGRELDNTTPIKVSGSLGCYRVEERGGGKGGSSPGVYLSSAMDLA